MIARSLRYLLLGVVVVGAGTAAVALPVGAAAGLSAMRAVSGGLLVVGSFVFAAGAVSGLRFPPRRAADAAPRESGVNQSPSEALAVSGILVGTGLVLVLVGIALDPETSL